MVLSSPLRFFHYLITKNAWIDIAHDFDAYRFAFALLFSLLAAICVQLIPKLHPVALAEPCKLSKSIPFHEHLTLVLEVQFSTTDA